VKMTKTLAAAAALACAAVTGQAQASVKIIGTATADSNGLASVALPVGNCVPRCEFRIEAPAATSIVPELTYSLHVMPKFSAPYDTTMAFQAWKTDVPNGFIIRIPIGAAAQMGKMFGPRTTVNSEILLSSVAKFVGAPNSLIDYRISVSPAPEPVTWALMVLGFGAIGAAMRRVRSETYALQHN